ncbi:serine protease family protein [Sessilibacter sp. MAH2]
MKNGRIKKKLNSYIVKASLSNIAKSTRRVFFNHLNASVVERGFFHVDQMYGSGSGVLIRYNNTFFLLTARHVIKNNIRGDFQNESAFWITSKLQGKWESLHDFLMPKKIWNIGELVSLDVEYIDVSDVCLIELFYPGKHHFPDHYIEIKGATSVLTKKDYFEGQYLLVTGYPFERNTFDFTPVSDDITHTTSIARHTIPGTYVMDRDVGFISFEMVESDVRHENVNGMSGGAVYNVQPKANQIKLAGIPVTAGDNICRFIPSYIFIDALLNYQDSSSTVVDPVVLNPPPLEDLAKSLFEYMVRFDPKFKDINI